MRILLITQIVSNNIIEMCDRLSISEMASGIPNRYRNVVSEDQLPVIIVESANHPGQVLRVLPINNPREFTYDFNTIEELPFIPPPPKLEDRINELEELVIDHQLRINQLERR